MKIEFREIRPTDIPIVAALEKESYPADEGASLSALQYRQHHAATFFRCATVQSEENPDIDEIIGYICSTRCKEFTHESMSLHVPNSPLLAIHSVVTKPQYRRKGIATQMLHEYVTFIKNRKEKTMEKIVLLAKDNLLKFYLKCGFSVKRPSPIVHGAEQWYELEMELKTNQHDCYVADAFADPLKMGTGNPAAVVILDRDEEPTDSWMQKVALEFNLSETAFVKPLSESNHFQIRYFTPAVEIPLCGHATLASAGILYQLQADASEITFHAPEDVLKVSLVGSHRIAMEFPMKPAIELMSATDVKGVQSMILDAFGIQSEDILFSGLSDIGDLLIETTVEAFKSIPHEGIKYTSLLQYAGYTRGVIVCCLAPEENGNAEENVDFYSRFFGPKAGVNEDPVTGSAHCVLAPYFFSKIGKDKVVGRQASSRGGLVECEKVDDSRVKLTGSVVTNMKGALIM